jgi:hypothetical protein
MSGCDNQGIVLSWWDEAERQDARPAYCPVEHQAKVEALNATMDAEAEPALPGLLKLVLAELSSVERNYWLAALRSVRKKARAKMEGMDADRRAVAEHWIRQTFWLERNGRLLAAVREALNDA